MWGFNKVQNVESEFDLNLDVDLDLGFLDADRDACLDLDDGTDDDRFLMFLL